VFVHLHRLVILQITKYTKHTTITILNGYLHARDHPNYYIAAFHLEIFISKLNGQYISCSAILPAVVHNTFESGIIIVRRLFKKDLKLFQINN